MTTKLEEVKEIRVRGETTIYDSVIASVAGMASREVEGVSSLGTSSIRRAIAERVGGGGQRGQGIAVEAGHREAILDVDLNVTYGFSIPEVVIKVRENVALKVLEICGLVTKEINVHVVGIEFPERIPGRLE